MILLETLIGLTFGQILAVIGLIGGILTVWVQMNVKIAKVEVRINELEKKRIEDCQRNDAFRIELNEKVDKLHDKFDNLADFLIKRRTK